MSVVSMDTFNACRDLMTSRSAAPQKKVLKYDEDFNKLISSEQFYKVCHGEQWINAIKKLASPSQETNEDSDIRRIVNDKTQCKVRDWLITHLLIDNSGSSVSGIKVTKFKAVLFYPNTEEDLAHYRILVRDHKTANDLYSQIDMYLRTVQSRFERRERRARKRVQDSNFVLFDFVFLAYE